MPVAIIAGHSTQHTHIQTPLTAHPMPAGRHLSVTNRSDKGDHGAGRHHCQHTRPETHQNLIHLSKDQHIRDRSRGPDAQRCRSHNIETVSSVTTTNLPQHQKNGGGERVRTDDPLLAKQVLSQLSYTPETLLRWPSDGHFLRSGAHGHKRPLRSGAHK